MCRAHHGLPHSMTVALVLLTTLLSSCAGSDRPLPQVPAGATLPQAVEAYMADLPGTTPKLSLSTRVYDRRGVLLGEFWDEGHRYWVPLNRISPLVLQAIIATEDHTFYSNPGVDWAAIVRAVVQNGGEGEITSGASTITQQLARNIAMPYERRLEQSLDRKISETLLAEDLTQRFTKDQILEMYLNVVYYGHLAYGVEAASLAFFGKSAAELNLAEAALLAGLPQSPATLDPLVPGNLERARVRQGLVLALMARNGYITQETAQAAYEAPLTFRPASTPTAIAPHFLNYVQQYVEAQYGKGAMPRGGFNIVTTLDLRLQRLAEEIVRKQVDAVRRQYNLTNAALVALKPGSGEILAMVGSADFYNTSISDQVNVTIMPRQPGSAIKPVLYSLAFTQGYSPADLIWDTATSYPLDNGRAYRPQNYDGSFHGPVRLRQALANSYNVPAVKLLYQLGVPAMLNMAKSMGLVGLDQPDNYYGLSLALGAGEVTLLSLTGAYATLANGGVRAAPTPILSITDATGKPRPDQKPAPGQILDPRIAYQVTSILTDNDARTPMFGTNSPLRLSRPVAAKTGTTSDWHDNWTLGYTPYLAVGVWAGNSNNSPMRNTTGLTGAAPIWHDFLEAVFADRELEAAVRGPGEPLDFLRPAGLVEMPVCSLSTLRLGQACPATRSEYLIDPSRPVTIGVRATPPSAGDPSTAATIALDPALALRRITRLPNGQVCRSDSGEQSLTVLRLPTDPREAQLARGWAAQAGIPVDPVPCEPMVAGSATPGA